LDAISSGQRNRSVGEPIWTSVSSASRCSCVAWWEKYLADDRFRFDEEVPAHIAEYAHIYEGTPKRALRRLHLSDIAERLAGPLYGRLTSKEAAMRLLKTGARVLLSSQPKED